MNYQILKNKSVNKEQMSLFLKKYSLLITYFNDGIKNQEIIERLNINRERFNKLQNEMFFHIVILEPKIKNIANNFNLFFNLSKYVVEEYLIVVKKCIVHFNKNISSVLYMHNSSYYIILKDLYHPNHRMSLIRLAIKEYVATENSHLIPLHYISEYIGASSVKRTKILFLEPLNDFFYLIDDFVFYCRKNNLRNYIREFKKKKIILSDRELYHQIKSLYKEKLSREKITNLSKFQHYLHASSCCQLSKKYTQEEILSFLKETEKLLTVKSINCFNKDYIKNCIFTSIALDDITCIFENYSDFIRINKNLYSISSAKKCLSSKDIIKEYVSKNKNYSIGCIKQLLFANGRILKELTIKNEISSI